MTSRVRLLDATLREGEQQHLIRFSGRQKAQVVQLLENFGVDLIEVGHPGISPEHEEICREAAAAARSAEILMHSRAVVEEVRAAHRAGARWVGIWASVNDVSLAAKFGGRRPEEVEEKVRAAVREAKRLGLKVRFTVEDASRTPCERLDDMTRVAVEAGADRISLADTTGVWEPKSCAEYVSWAVEHLGCEIEVHLHNDLGLASANALAAIDAGVSVVDVSILGIGERAGIADLLSLTVMLREKRGDERYRLEMIPQLARTVERMTGFRPDAIRPVVGDNVFTHAGKYHTDAVRRDPDAYEPFPPELVGRTRHLVEGPTPPPVSSSALLVGKPFLKGASELKYHRDGPGVRWVWMDSRVDPRASLYVIQRSIGLHGIPFTPEKHVDRHTHNCDSLFVFWGDQADGTGLTCCVELGEESETVHSPASVFIPAGVEHTYHYVSGQGTYTNIVLAPDYQSSLEEREEVVRGAADSGE